LIWGTDDAKYPIKGDESWKEFDEEKKFVNTEMNWA